MKVSKLMAAAIALASVAALPVFAQEAATVVAPVGGSTAVSGAVVVGGTTVAAAAPALIAIGVGVAAVAATESNKSTNGTVQGTTAGSVR